MQREREKINCQTKYRIWGKKTRVLQQIAW
jgi:hypothetical protein